MANSKSTQKTSTKKFTRLRDELDVVAREHDLIFDVVRTHKLDAWRHRHSAHLHKRVRRRRTALNRQNRNTKNNNHKTQNAHLLLTEEVADFNAGAVVDDGHVVRKVGIHKAHLVLEALRRVAHTPNTPSATWNSHARTHRDNTRHSNNAHRAPWSRPSSCCGCATR